ncbi:teichoic acid D-Ala incorporation-associated protein DltX [Lacticaseibacillus zhaodongensis]|nr:teichoic acid D-Ala incorporation-associated protein DltX [Lacticaseibacillus zhaodongensis]
MHKYFEQHPAASFILRTAIYAAIILTLVYLYSYRGVSGAHFIYNEF